MYYEDMNIQIIRKKRKTITIKITEKGGVIVSCPTYCSDENIKKIITEKQAWINKTLQKINNKLSSKKDYYSYSKILFLGKKADQ